jgi:Mrp family chromosome partitioning ATPase
MNMNRSVVLPDRLHLDEETAYSSQLPSRAAPSDSNASSEVPLNGAEAGTVSQVSGRVMAALSPEQFKLRNALLFAHEQQGVRSTLVTGTSEGVGTTSIAVALALGLVMDPNKEVLLIDANVQRPQLHKLFHLKMSEGVTAASDDGANFLEMAVVVGTPNLHVIPSVGSNRRATFDARRLVAVMPALHEAFDFVIVDAPPLELHPDVLMLSLHLNSVIVVAEAERTRIQEVQKITKELHRAKANLLGVVLNRQRDHLPRTIQKLL